MIRREKVTITNKDGNKMVGTIHYTKKVKRNIYKDLYKSELKKRLQQVNEQYLSDKKRSKGGNYYTLSRTEREVKALELMSRDFNSRYNRLVSQ